MMDKREFYSKVEELVRESLGDMYIISTHKVKKLNVGAMTALLIMKKGENLSLNIYLDGFFEEFVEGKNIADVVLDIIEVYFDSEKKNENLSADTSFFDNPELVKERLFCRVVNTEHNAELLEDIPHKEILNLSVTCSILVNKDEEGVGSVALTNQLLERFGWDIDETVKTALENTQKLFPERISGMEDMLRELMGGDLPPEMIPEGAESGLPIVVTNTTGVNGFTVILYPGVLEQLAKRKNANLIIIPSSVHEALVLADDGKMSTEDIESMIQEVNCSCVNIDEKLSNKAYYYDQETGLFSFMGSYKKGDVKECVGF